MKEVVSGCIYVQLLLPKQQTAAVVELFKEKQILPDPQQIKADGVNPQFIIGEAVYLSGITTRQKASELKDSLLEIQEIFVFIKPVESLEKHTLTHHPSHDNCLIVKDRYPSLPIVIPQPNFQDGIGNELKEIPDQQLIYTYIREHSNVIFTS